MAAKRPDSNLYTEVEAVGHLATWTIQKFPLLTTTTDCKTAIESAEFAIQLAGSGGDRPPTLWSLRCYPNGNKEANAGHVSLFLCCSNTGQPAEGGEKGKTRSLRALVEFRLGGHNSQPANQRRKSLCHDFVSGYCRGFPEYLSHEALAASPHTFLTREDRLVVECRIVLLPEDGPRSYLCSSSRNGRPLKRPHSPDRATTDAVMAAGLQTWEALVENNFVDLGPSSVTLYFAEEQEEVRCHSFPLAARSPVFRAMLSADMLERRSGRIQVADMSVAAGKDLLYYLYTGSVRPVADLRELLAAADKYGIAELKEHCVDSLGATMSDATCVELLVLGDMCAATELKERALHHIVQNSGRLVRRPSWDQPLLGRPQLFREMVEVVFARES